MGLAGPVASPANRRLTRPRHRKRSPVGPSKCGWAVALYCGMPRHVLFSGSGVWNGARRTPLNPIADILCLILSLIGCRISCRRMRRPGHRSGVLAPWRRPFGKAGKRTRGAHRGRKRGVGAHTKRKGKTVQQKPQNRAVEPPKEVCCSGEDVQAGKGSPTRGLRRFYAVPTLPPPPLQSPTLVHNGLPGGGRRSPSNPPPPPEF